jgi:hypothetical protein
MLSVLLSLVFVLSDNNTKIVKRFKSNIVIPLTHNKREKPFTFPIPSTHSISSHGKNNQTIPVLAPKRMIL